MTTFTREFHGPVVPAGVTNQILRDALFHSTVARPQTTAGDYHRLDLGVREGANTSWIGSWDQRTNNVEQTTPLSVLDSARLNMRLRAGQVLVVKVTMAGDPSTIVGSRVSFRCALVGGREGPPKPLVAGGAGVADAASRTAFAALERQINTGGLNEWDDSVTLADPVTGMFNASTSHTAVTQTINSGTYGNGTVSVALTMPPSCSMGYVFVSTNATVIATAAGGAGSLFMVVYDGTTTYGEQALTTSLTEAMAISCSYAGTITASTTFRPQFKQATNNVDVNRQTISVLVAWV